MTFLEKAMESREESKQVLIDMMCPCDCDLEDDMACEGIHWNNETCTKCWNREYPEPCKETTGTVKDDPINPAHYTNNGMEAIQEMIAVFGKETVAHFCLCNVWKYRKRALHKNGLEDLDKSDWYMNKYWELMYGGE